MQMLLVKTLKFMMWLACLAINLLGSVLALKAGTTTPAIYATFVIAT
jgi:hypothetical protein